MAGLLPSEEKLRGSPANILGRCARGKICRAFFFSGHRVHHDFRAQNFLSDGSDDACDSSCRREQAMQTLRAKNLEFMRVCTMLLRFQCITSSHACSRDADRIRDTKISRRVTQRRSTRRIARHRSREKISRAAIMFRVRDDDRATATIDRDRVSESMRASRRRERTRTRERAGIASPDHRDSKIDRRTQNRRPPPESATRGETGHFESFSPPIATRCTPHHRFLRRGDAPMQHPAPARATLIRDRRSARPRDRSIASATMRDAQMKRAGGYPPALRIDRRSKSLRLALGASPARSRRGASSAALRS